MRRSVFYPLAHFVAHLVAGLHSMLIAVATHPDVPMEIPLA